MENQKKILLVQLFSNGDCLYATAVARQIKKDYPGCYLTWAIAEFCKNIIKGNPYVDEIWPTDEVPKNDVVAFRKFKRKVFLQKKEGKWDEVFITHNMDQNQALYDGTIRGMIFLAYGSPITVPVQPVIVLSDEEKEKVKQFSEAHQLDKFKNVILWEFAPQSGQSVLDFDFVMKTALRITKLPDTCIILSSAKSFPETLQIIDGSNLSVRENAELTHYCTLLIGCSSGITWLTTSSAAKQLPMVQLLDAQAYFRNTPSVDFERFGLPTDGLIEMTKFNEEIIYKCVDKIAKDGIRSAKKEFNQELPLQFNTTRKVVYNLLCYLHLRAIIKHYRITTSIYGRNALFIRQFILGFITFPFKLIANKWQKWIVSKF